MLTAGQRWRNGCAQLQQLLKHLLGISLARLLAELRLSQRTAGRVLGAVEARSGVETQAKLSTEPKLRQRSFIPLFPGITLGSHAPRVFHVSLRRNWENWVPPMFQVSDFY